MNYLNERVAYLKGLAEGMQISDSTNEGKLLKAIIDVLDDMASSINDIEENQDQLSRQVDEIDEDLGEIEKIVFEEDDDEDYDDYNDEYKAEIECPHCNQLIEVTSDMIDDDDDTIECPICHEKIEFEWECDCGCGCDDCEDHDEE